MRIPIRWKLAGALAVPVLALVGVTGYEVAQASDRAGEAASETSLATAAVGPGSLISRLQEERNFTLIELVGLAGLMRLDVDSYDAARAATDAAAADLEALVAARRDAVGSAFTSGLEAVRTDLQALRADVDAVPPARTLENSTFTVDFTERFQRIIDTLIDDTADVGLDVDDAELRNGVELIAMSTRDMENFAAVGAEVSNHLLGGGVQSEVRIEVNGLLQRFLANRELITQRATGPYEGLPEQFLFQGADQEQFANFQRFVSTGQIDMDQLTQGYGDEVPAMVQLRAEVAAVLQSEADAIVDRADWQRRVAVTVGGILVLAALAVTIAASRSITNPLQSLTRQARTMAADRLPAAVQQVLDTLPGDDVVVPLVAPIAVRTRDEVAEVASALNTVQSSALDLAVEQAALRKNIADSFVNLGRRNQNLLDRQLELITDLERQEHEPERLEDLFRLDHLATRMRRNAESLLRLAGGGDSTQAGWAGAVPMVDVVRGALGEVEEYQRVQVGSVEPATVRATTGADLAHAIAELVENALHFSPPEERVQVRGRLEPSGGYVLAIVDEGVGMTEEQLAVANRRLAGEESFTVAPSRYLGHYVAGHLAGVLGLRITLAQQPVGGIIARIDVPAGLLVTTQDEVPVSTPPLPTPPAAAPDPGPPDPPTVPAGSGLARRIRGASAPTTVSVAAAFGGVATDPGPVERATATPSSAEDVASFLTAFTGGVNRGLASSDAQAEPGWA